MIRITMLGTSGATPTKLRSLPGVALSYEGNVFLFDCGEGTQMQLIRRGVNMSRIRAILLTHAHGDHVIGVAGLVRSLALAGRKEPLLIFVPKGYEGVVKSLVSFDKAVMTYPIGIRGVEPGKVYRGRDFTISAFRLSHNIPACGYIFKTDDKKRFIKDKCSRLGLEGEMYSILQKKGRLRLGKKTVRISEVTRREAGKKIVYACDTRPSQATVAAARGADLLIHEATYADSEKGLARERAHSTASEAARIARKAGARRLVLTHISARYKSQAQQEAESRKIFANAVVAKDGDDIFI